MYYQKDELYKAKENNKFSEKVNFSEKVAVQRASWSVITISSSDGLNSMVPIESLCNFSLLLMLHFFVRTTSYGYCDTQLVAGKWI